jgi:hypothetical protein
VLGYVKLCLEALVIEGSFEIPIGKVVLAAPIAWGQPLCDFSACSGSFSRVQ